MLITMVLAHWLACLWGFVGLDDYVDLSTWTEGVEPPAWEGYLSDQTWRSKAKVLDAGPWDHYGMAIYVALNTIFGGSCEINPANFVEFYTQAFMLILGSSVWAYVIGSACGVIATLDPALIEYRQTLDELNYFVKDQAIPPELTVKLRSYFRNTMHLVRAKRYDQLLQKMSTRLRGDAAFRMSMNIFGNVPYLTNPELEAEFMCNLAIKYSMTVYSRLERVPCTNLFVVERGVVAKRGRLGLAGACFGRDVILSNNNLRDLGDAIALTFVQTISLSQKDIFDLLPDYPMAYLVIRRAALGMALARALVKAAEIVKKSRLSITGRPIAEVFDQAMDIQVQMQERAEAERAEYASAGGGENDSIGEKPKPSLFPVLLNEGKEGSDAVMRALKRGMDISRQNARDAERSGIDSRAAPVLWGALGSSLKRAPKFRVLSTDEKIGNLAKTVEAQHTDAMKRIVSLERSVREGAEAFQAGLRAFTAFTERWQTQQNRPHPHRPDHGCGREDLRSSTPEPVRSTTVRPNMASDPTAAPKYGAMRKQRPKPRSRPHNSSGGHSSTGSGGTLSASIGPNGATMARDGSAQSLAVTTSSPTSCATLSGATPPGSDGAGTPRGDAAREAAIERAESRADFREEGRATTHSTTHGDLKSSPFDA